VPNNFADGEVATANEVNENFESLDARINALETPLERDSLGFLTIAVDCTNEPGALEDILQVSAQNDPVLFDISGNCAFSNGFQLRGRQIVIRGEFGAEIKPRLLIGNNSFQVKNTGLDLSDLDVDGVSLFNLAQNASVTLTRTDFINSTAATRIVIRPASNLRLQDALQTDDRPRVNATAGDLWIRSVAGVTKLGPLSAVMGSRIWCRYCNVDIPSVELDTNTSFCVGSAFDVANPSNATHLNIESLDLRFHSVFLHTGAPSDIPPYTVTLSSDSLAEWSTSAEPERCLNRF
jgi:hypothetical protein